MSKAEHRQLTFAFADSPQGDRQAAPSDVSVGKAWLSLTAEGKEESDSVAWTADSSRLLEAATSVSNLAQALREQLGLKVESTRGPIPILVIDKVARPSEN